MFSQVSWYLARPLSIRKLGTYLVLEPIFQDEAAARKHLEHLRWPKGAICPKCGKARNVKQLGEGCMGEGWYHCRSCRRKFTVRVGTVFGRSHIPLHKWLLAEELITLSFRHGQQPTASWLHKQLGITYRSARLLVDRWNLYVPNGGPLWWVAP